MAIQPGFSSKVICSFENRPIGYVYKTGTKYASKEEIGLAVFETFSEAPARGMGIRALARGIARQNSSMGSPSVTP